MPNDNIAFKFEHTAHIDTNLTLFGRKFGKVFGQQQNQSTGFGTNFTELVDSQVLKSNENEQNLVDFRFFFILLFIYLDNTQCLDVVQV